MIDFSVSEPFLVDGMQLLRCTVLGQSFLMHQIRKMIGLAVMVASERASPSAITDALTVVAFPTPMAPGLGLLLDETLFDSYNKMNEEKKRKQVGAEPHIHINREACGVGTVDAFKLKVIYPKIVAGELKDRPFAIFIEQSDAHNMKYTPAASASDSDSASSTSTSLPSSVVPSSLTSLKLAAASEGRPPATQTAAVPQIYQLILTNPGNAHFSGAKLVKMGPLSTLDELKLAIREKLGPETFAPEQDLVLHCAGGVAVKDEASFRAMPTRGKLDIC